MGRAKEITVKPICSTDAKRIVKTLHYSGTVVPNSQLHFGAFLDGRCGGALSFGPSMDQASAKLVHGTQPREFIELNRMAFADWLPRNSESRCISVALRLIRRNYPHLKWCLSFSDATQCGDGTIYRASGFLLTGIKKNGTLRRNPATGKVLARMTAYHRNITQEFNSWEPLPGFQLKYVYFLHPHERANLAVPVLPYSAIAEAGATMYKGVRPEDA